ncbi:MAG TPA: hypothetical protein VGK33_00935 [Chloroflexota bacterium]
MHHDSCPPPPDDVASIQIGGDVAVVDGMHPTGRAERSGDFEQHPRHTNDVVGSALLPHPTGYGLADTHDGLLIPTQVDPNSQQSLAQLTSGCTFHGFQLTLRHHPFT